MTTSTGLEALSLLEGLRPDEGPISSLSSMRSSAEILGNFSTFSSSTAIGSIDYEKWNTGEQKKQWTTNTQMAWGEMRWLDDNRLTYTIKTFIRMFQVMTNLWLMFFLSHWFICSTIWNPSNVFHSLKTALNVVINTTLFEEIQSAHTDSDRGRQWDAHRGRQQRCSEGEIQTDS